MKRWIPAVLAASMILTLFAGCSRTCSVCSYGGWIEESAATCENEGRRARQCSVCHTKEIERIEKLEHTTSGEWETAKLPTCTETGKKINWCDLCGCVLVEDIATTAHNYSNGQCTYCGLGATTQQHSVHSYGAWTVTEDSTCSTAGSRERKCTQCGAIQTEALSKEEHSVDEETGICDFCNEQVSRPAGLGDMIEIRADWGPTSGAYTRSIELFITNNSSSSFSFMFLYLNGEGSFEARDGTQFDDMEFKPHTTTCVSVRFSDEVFLTSSTEGFLNPVTWNGEGYYKVNFGKNGITSVQKDHYGDIVYY